MTSRTLALGLTVAAAILTTLAAQVTTLDTPIGTTLATVAAVAAGLVPVVHTRSGRTAVEAWTRARSVSEALKAELLAFLAGVVPYRQHGSEALLLTRTERVLADAGDLIAHTAGVHPVSRQLPPVHDAESYAAERLTPQISWYRSKAGELARRLRWAARAEVALSVAAVILAAIAATAGSTGASAWVAVATTLTASVTAHAAASRWDYQLVEYLRTAAELERLRTAWVGSVKDETTADRLVERSENVVSAQNEAWMAKWSADDA